MQKIILPQVVAIGIYNAQAVYKNKTITVNRKTSMFEIELPIGNGGVSYIDDTSHLISENVIICAKPGQTRHTKLPFRCYYLHLIINEGQLFDMLSCMPNYVEIENTSHIKDIFNSLCNYFNMQNSENDVLIQSLILKLLHSLFKYSSTTKTQNRAKNNRKVIEKTIEYISENLTVDLSLEKLSNLFGYTSIYFHKLFKASTGKTLHDFVEDQRIRKAIDLMLSTDKALTQIAYDCGFSSQAYFSYAFKKKKGQTPREYIKQILLDYEKNLNEIQLT